MSAAARAIASLVKEEESKPHPVASAKADKKLFTPGPLCVSDGVRSAMNRDLGSRDAEFIQIVKDIRKSLIQVADLNEDEYTAILMQGSGTYGVEAVLTSVCDRRKKVLILASGAYGTRMELICQRAGIPCKLLAFAETEIVSGEKVREALLAEEGAGEIGAVALVHCETTSGILNPISEIKRIVKEVDERILFIVDAMSSFGGVLQDFTQVDFLISSPNKCLQGVPGFSFVIASLKSLNQCQGRATSLCLDIYDQWACMEKNGQFRFTPPVHCILALKKALAELQEEGGVAGREKRYKENNSIVKEGMNKLGFRALVPSAFDGHIITSFYYPDHNNFSFDRFYDRLSTKGQLIYPGKVTNADCFRIGNIGHLFPQDMHRLVDCVKETLAEMDCQLV